LRLILLVLSVNLAAAAQAPRIGLIDFYGRRTVAEEPLRAALGAREGDPLPRSKGDVEEAIEKVPNVVHARLEAACCEDGKAILYVGIEEKGAAHFTYLTPPVKPVMLPHEIHDEYTAFLSAVGLAVRAGETAEDLSRGHSLMANEGVRKHQEKFLELAEAHLPKLKEVLRESLDEEHRAIAAYVIGYAPKKQDVVNDLQHALRDSDDTVRNNAMRSLGAIAVLAARDPASDLKISPTWFLEMLDSLIWSDRITAANILVTLTERRDPDVRERIRERALPALLEMARWKHLPHALPAFVLLGRVAGVAEPDIQALWSKGDREALLKKLQPAAVKKK
jgi:hypothetical protein